MPGYGLAHSRQCQHEFTYKYLIFFIAMPMLLALTLSQRPGMHQVNAILMRTMVVNIAGMKQACDNNLEKVFG